MPETPRTKRINRHAQLLENGFKVQMVPTSCLSQPVDSIEDIKTVKN